MTKKDLKTCPCCGYRVFSSIGDYEICPICFWEDDIVQLRFPSLAGGANEPSLIQAQQNFIEYGAMEKRFIDKVRKPEKDEIKDPKWRIVLHTDIIEKPIKEDEELIPYPNDSTRLYYWSENYWLKNREET